MELLYKCELCGWLDYSVVTENKKVPKKIIPISERSSKERFSFAPILLLEKSKTF